MNEIEEKLRFYEIFENCLIQIEITDFDNLNQIIEREKELSELQ